MHSHSIHQQIVSNARTATNALAVVLRTWEPGTEHAVVKAIDGLDLPALDGLQPEGGAGPERFAVAPDVNTHQEAVYYQGKSVQGPFGKIMAGTFPAETLDRLSKSTGIRYTSVRPLFIRGSVAGSLTFHTTAAPCKADSRVFEAFAQQVSLTLENAHLLDQLEERVEELRKTRRLMNAANEAGRRHIAELLHGAVQTQLLIADFTLRQAVSAVRSDPEKAERLVNEARDRIDSVREHEIREASHLLHPAIINLGLGPAVRSLTTRFESALHLTVTIDPRLDGIGAALNESLAMNLRLAAYRIIEEALVNAHRHGAASRVSLDLDVVKDEELVLVVSDNGVGFMPSLAERGMGFHAISDYVDQVGGSWHVTSVPSRGTTLTARFPLDVSPKRSGLTRSGSR